MKGDNYVRIDINDVTVNDRNKFDIVNNSIVFVNVTDVPSGSKLDILVVQTDEGIANLGNVNSIDIVSQNITSVNTVGTNIAAVVNNSNNMAAIQAVDANMPAVVNAVQSATDAAASEAAAAASQVAAAASEVAAASSETLSTLAKNAAEASAVSAATSYDDFQDIYLGSKTTEPTVDNDGDPLATGALYFNSPNRSMRVWDGVGWINASTVGGASLNNFNFTAVGGQTTFTGLDDNSKPLAYTVKSIIVTLNGVTLKEGTEYTANDALSIVLTTGATAGDDLHVVAFKSFSADDLISGATGGTFNADVTFNDNYKAIFGAGSDLEIRADSLGASIIATPSLEISSYDIITIGGNNSILPNMIVDSASGTAFLDSLGSPVANIPNNSLGTAVLNIDLDVNGTVTATTLAGDGSGITGVLKNVTKTVLTAGTAATYTTPTDAFAIEVEVLGAGGGGGGVDGQGSGTAACGIAGGAGGYSQKMIMNPASSYTYTIGAGGAGGAAGANIGSVGGTTSFTDGASVTLSSSGGEGGTGRNASGGGSPNGGVLGGVASGGDLNVQGQCSTAGVTVSGARAGLSMGGHTKYGAGALASNSTAKSPTGFGSGGGAPVVQNSTSNYAGTAGMDGVIVITEYRE
jgi:hypothetical protein